MSDNYEDKEDLYTDILQNSDVKSFNMSVDHKKILTDEVMTEFYRLQNEKRIKNE